MSIAEISGDEVIKLAFSVGLMHSGLEVENGIPDKFDRLEFSAK